MSATEFDKANTRGIKNIEWMAS